MKIPKTIKIGNLIYKMGILPPSEQEDFLGRSSMAQQFVNIHPLLGPDKSAEVFWHEASHQILDQAGFYKESKNEKMVRALGNGIYQILKDNGFVTK